MRRQRLTTPASGQVQRGCSTRSWGPLARRWAALSVLFVGVVCVSPAPAAEPAQVDVALHSDGSGLLIANSQTNPQDETWSWQACASDGSDCQPFSSGRVVSTGSARPGTVFTATSSYGATAVSPEWHGDVSPTRAPSVSGSVRANALVTPVLAEWQGGWVGDFDETQLAACANPDGTECTSLTDSHYVGNNCPNGSAVIDPAFTGRYLRVADQRDGRNTGFADYGMSSPYGAAIWQQGNTTAVSVVGQIAPATGGREADCGPPPLTSTTPPAGGGARPPSPKSVPDGPFTCAWPSTSANCPTAPTAVLGARGVARVRCRSACTIIVRAEHGRRNVHSSWRLAHAAIIHAGLSAKLLARLARGRTVFSVSVDGRILTQRVVRIR